MEKTLGGRFDRVNGDVILRSTRKLLAIKNRDDPEFLKSLNLKPEDPDDRDNPAFMSLLGPEDIIAERLRAGSRQLRQILWKAGRMGNFTNLNEAWNKSPLGSFLPLPNQALVTQHVAMDKGFVIDKPLA